VNFRAFSWQKYWCPFVVFFLKAPDMLNSVLLQNRGHVGLGDVVCKGAVTKHYLCVAGGFQFLVPVDNSLREVFYFLAAYRVIKAGKQHSITDTVNGFTRYGLFFNGTVRSTPRFNNSSYSTSCSLLPSIKCSM